MEDLQKRTLNVMVGVLIVSAVMGIISFAVSMVSPMLLLVVVPIHFALVVYLLLFEIESMIEDTIEEVDQNGNVEV